MNAPRDTAESGTNPSNPGADTLRETFEEMIGLAPEARMARLASLDIAEGVRNRVQAMLVFDECAALAPADREERIAALNLPEAVQSLLRKLLNSDPFAANPVRSTALEVSSRLRDDDESARPPLVGTLIGTFRLLNLIGEGGSSSVFRAAREVGDGSQIVALKLLRTGLYSADAQRRFRREQAILAQLTHPNIASLVEGGISSAGVPYIAMELVDGVPITKAADQRGLGLESRLAWFITLCRTIEAAHRALIVHRDLKPSNVFVTHDGNLKVLDFGIAKLLDDEDFGVTRTQSVALTPEYAAPEQYGSEPLTTAVDVYALGIVLGELLTGRRLVAGQKTSGMLDDVEDTAPLPVGMPPRAALARRLRGDLDSILVQATAEDQNMRYRSAGALADDVDRYLAGEAVRAHPPAPWYRARKFIGRHRLGLAALVTFLSLMVASTAIVAWQANKTQREATRANVIRDFLEDMFTPIRNGMINEKQASVRDMLAVATDKLGKDATLGDEARIDLQLLFSRLHGQLNDFDQAQALIGQAQALATSSLAEDDPLRLDAEISYAGNLLESGNAKQAEPLLQALESRIEGRRILRGAPLVRLYDNLAEASDMQGKHDDSAVLHERKALAERIGTFGPESPKVAAGYSNLATSLSATSGHVDEVVEGYRHAYEIYLANFGPDSFFTALSRRNLSLAQSMAGRFQAARAGLLAVESTLEAPPNAKHEANVLYWSQRCQLATDIGGRQDEGACAHAERAAKENVSPDNPGLRATTLLYLAEWDMDQGAFDSARRRVQEARDLVSAAGNPVGIGATDYLLGVLDLASGDAESSVQRFGDAIRNLGHHHPEFRRMNALALRAMVCSRRPELPPTSCPGDADGLARSELDALPLRWHPRLLPAHVALARIDVQRGHAAAAVERLRDAIAHSKADVDAGQLRLVEARLWLAVAEGAMGDCARAAADAAGVAEALVENGVGKHPVLVAVSAQWPPACGAMPAIRP